MGVPLLAREQAWCSWCGPSFSSEAKAAATKEASKKEEERSKSMAATSSGEDSDGGVGEDEVEKMKKLPVCTQLLFRVEHAPSVFAVLRVVVNKLVQQFGMKTKSWS